MGTKNRTIVQDYHSSIEAARRSQIINYTVETICDLGYTKTSLDQVAKRAKISKSVISYHFGDKNGLIEQVVNEIYIAGGYFMLPEMDGQLTPKGKLLAYIQANIEFISTHRVQMIALVDIMNNLRTADGTLRYNLNTEEPVLNVLGNLLKDGQKVGEFREFDTRMMAFFIRRSIDALPSLLVTDPELDLDPFKREMVDLFDRATRME